MNRELTRVTVVVLIAFLAIGVSSAFWSVIQAKSLLARSDNARNVIEQERIQRGAIVDRNGERLAYTVENEDGTARRARSVITASRMARRGSRRRMIRSFAAIRGGRRGARSSIIRCTARSRAAMCKPRSISACSRRQQRRSATGAGR
jgi:hypothetical protein